MDVHLFVAISYGKGVCFSESYEKLSGARLAELVKKKFKSIFTNSCNPKGDMVIQDGAPSQNSKAAVTQVKK